MHETSGPSVTYTPTRTKDAHTKEVGHLRPLLVALGLLAVTALVSMLIVGGVH
jgi:hypothetical protein